MKRSAKVHNENRGLIINATVECLFAVSELKLFALKIGMNGKF